MEFLKKFVKGVWVGFFAVLAFSALVGAKSVGGTLIFLIAGSLFTPLGDKLKEKMPEVIKPNIVIGVVACILFFAGAVIMSDDNKRNEERDAVEETTIEEDTLIAENDVVEPSEDDSNTEATVESTEEDEAAEDNNTVENDTEDETDSVASGDENLSENPTQNVSEQVSSDSNVETVTEGAPIETTPAADAAQDTTPVQPATEPVVDTTTSTTVTYVLNTNTMKCHVPSCSSVEKIKPENRLDFTGTAAEAQAMGYDACGNCHPW